MDECICHARGDICGDMARCQVTLGTCLFFSLGYVDWTHAASVVVYIVLLGMASVDSSAPETTSSDNSPTLVRRNFTGGSGGATAAGHHGGPGSDSGSSHSDSVESSSSGCKPVMQQAQQPRGALKAQQNDADKYVTQCFESLFFVAIAFADCPLHLITNL